MDPVQPCWLEANISPEVRQTEAASPTDVASSSSPLPRLTGLLLYTEDEKELLLELCSHHTVDDKVSRGIHDNQEPWEVSVSRN